MSQHDPLRWTDSASGSAPELASAVRAIRKAQGSTAQLDALSARLHAQLTAQATTASGVASTTRALSRTKLFVLAGACILALGSFAYFARTSQAPVTTKPLITRPAPAPKAEGMKPPAYAPPSTEPAVEAAAPQARPARSTNRASSRPATGATPRLQVSKTVDAEGELELLGRAQVALDRDPSAALALAAEHAREYPRGVFSEEREVLALEAELKLKRDAAAHARAERFMSHYPRSAHARRVRTLLDASSNKALRSKPSNNPVDALTPTP